MLKEDDPPANQIKLIKGNWHHFFIDRFCMRIAVCNHKVFLCHPIKCIGKCNLLEITESVTKSIE